MVEFQPITQVTKGLPNIKSVNEMAVVITDGEYYIALGGEWKKIISKKRYAESKATGTGITAPTTVSWQKTFANNITVKRSGINISAKGTYKATIDYNTGISTAAGTITAVDISLTKNGSPSQTFRVTTSDDVKCKGNGSRSYFVELIPGDEISVKLTPQSSHTFDYQITLKLEVINA